MGNTFGHLAGGVDAVEGEFGGRGTSAVCGSAFERREHDRSEEHTSELQSLMRISYAVFCLKKKKNRTQKRNNRKNKFNKKNSNSKYRSGTNQHQKTI